VGRWARRRDRCPEPPVRRTVAVPTTPGGSPVRWPEDPSLRVQVRFGLANPYLGTPQHEDRTSCWAALVRYPAGQRARRTARPRSRRVRGHPTGAPSPLAPGPTVNSWSARVLGRRCASHDALVRPLLGSSHCTTSSAARARPAGRRGASSVGRPHRDDREFVNLAAIRRPGATSGTHDAPDGVKIPLPAPAPATRPSRLGIPGRLPRGGSRSDGWGRGGAPWGDRRVMRRRPPIGASRPHPDRICGP